MQLLAAFLLNVGVGSRVPHHQAVLALPASLRDDPGGCHDLRATVYYRGVPILSAGGIACEIGDTQCEEMRMFQPSMRPNLTIAAPALNSCHGPWSFPLDDPIVQSIFSASCSAATQKPALKIPTDVPTDVVIAALEAAAYAPTPAFNVDDHYQLAGAVIAANRDVPEDVAHQLEVGTFLCHTAVYQAAVARELGVSARMVVHAIDRGRDARRYCDRWNQDRKQGPPVHFHQGTAITIPRTVPIYPLRLFFEDSMHDYIWTKRAFDTFEPYLVEGGVVVMHDVGCCGNEYPQLQRFGRERMFRNSQYREIRSPLPSTWAELNETQRSRMLAGLRGCLDTRPRYRAPAEMTTPATMETDCNELCRTSNFSRKASLGYAWSMCMNTRVFQRIVRQRAPLVLRVERQMEWPGKQRGVPREWDIGDGCDPGALAKSESRELV